MRKNEQNNDIGEEITQQYTTPYRLTLIAPLMDTDGVSIQEIDLQEPTLAEIETLAINTQKYNSIKAFQILLANHTNLDVPTIKTIGARDFGAVQKYYDYFFGG